jgi:OTU domain-containing protein 6
LLPALQRQSLQFENIILGGMDSGDEHTKTRAELRAQHAIALQDVARRADVARMRVPKKDRTGRARVAEEFAAEHAALVAAHVAELEASGGEAAEDESEWRGGAVEAFVAGGIGEDVVGAPSGRAKESKAARRRRQKLEADAASERRIAEEKAGMGPSDRERETAAIVELLRPLGLVIHDIAPDGHCLYAAIAHQLQLLASVDSNTKDARSPVHDVHSLRGATADRMVAAPDEYMPFLETVECDEGKYAAYCVRVRTEAAWGGQVELRALATILDVLIEVYAAGMPLLVMGGEKDASVSTTRLRLSFHRKYYDLGDHYNSVVRRGVAL